MGMIYTHTSQSSSSRALAMVLALASAVVLSPLYMDRKKESYYYEISSSSNVGWIFSSGFVLPMILVGLIIAIKTTSSSSSSTIRVRGDDDRSRKECSWVLKIGSSSWGLAGVLVMLMFVLSCQQHFVWR